MNGKIMTRKHSIRENKMSENYQPHFGYGIYQSDLIKEYPEYMDTDPYDMDRKHRITMVSNAMTDGVDDIIITVEYEKNYLESEEDLKKYLDYSKKVLNELFGKCKPKLFLKNDVF